LCCFIDDATGFLLPKFIRQTTTERNRKQLVKQFLHKLKAVGLVINKDVNSG